ncbi:MAG: hypothetical protein MUE71_03465, partial [Chitinophagaceae bacterium]|nr:hypothetical protein [Chitinophagaceae bacterium]
MKRLLRISRFAIVVLVGLLSIVWIGIQLPPVQQMVARGAAHKISRVIGARVEIGGFGVGLLNNFSLKRLRIYDKNGDTLLSVGNCRLAITDWFPLKDTIEIKYLRLNDVHVKIQRFDSVWNTSFLDQFFQG